MKRVNLQPTKEGESIRRMAVVDTAPEIDETRVIGPKTIRVRVWDRFFGGHVCALEISQLVNLVVVNTLTVGTGRKAKDAVRHALHVAFVNQEVPVASQTLPSQFEAGLDAYDANSSPDALE